MKPWAAFWIFITVFFLSDLWLHRKGMNTFFWQYKTPAELEYQRKLLGLKPADEEIQKCTKNN